MNPHSATLPASRITRIAYGTFACGLFGLLGIAAWLSPDPSGMGTHQQLSLPPCAFTVLFDIPCPSCGMTTSWSHLVRGQLISAFQANAGGALLGMLSVGSAPWMLWVSVRGRFPEIPVSDVHMALALLVIIVVTFADWGWRLWWDHRFDALIGN